MIRCEQLGCHVGERALLQALSLTLDAGQCVAVVGPNGAGKSTLLRLLSGERLLRQDGEVQLSGRALHDWPLPELARRRSFLMQSHANELASSVTELVTLGAYPHGGLRLDQRALLDEALARWELTSLHLRSYLTLSGGERQRVHLARTWLQLRLHETAAERLWLLDEPLNGLDLPHQQLLQRSLREQAGEGALVIFSVHDLNFALRTADTVLALSQGKLLYAGQAAGLAEPALLRDIFGTAFLCLSHPKDGQPLVLPE